LLQKKEEELRPALDEILAAHAVPIIKEIVPYRIGNTFHPNTTGKDLEDIQGEAILRLLTRLRDFRMHSEEKPIRDFEKYVAWNKTDVKTWRYYEESRLEISVGLM
jgi:hypothetical protein